MPMAVLEADQIGELLVAEKNGEAGGSLNAIWPIEVALARRQLARRLAQAGGEHAFARRGPATARAGQQFEERIGNCALCRPYARGRRAEAYSVARKRRLELRSGARASARIA